MNKIDREVVEDLPHCGRPPTSTIEVYTSIQREIWCHQIVMWPSKWESMPDATRCKRILCKWKWSICAFANIYWLCIIAQFRFYRISTGVSCSIENSELDVQRHHSKSDDQSYGQTMGTILKITNMEKKMWKTRVLLAVWSCYDSKYTQRISTTIGVWCSFTLSTSN